jgi:ribosomal protein L16 Arg81 hydroxylase
MAQKLGRMVRQGDVLYIPVDRIPDGAKLEDTKTVAYGEVTGHHHTMVELDTKSKAEVYTLEDQMFAKVLGDVVVTHQEHNELVVEEGIYEIRIQREYTPEDIRRVLD